MTFSIEHSGKTWVSLGRGPRGDAIWPIEEMFARRYFGPTVQARIRKMTGGVLEEGSLFIPGWHPKPQSWRRTKRLVQSGRSFNKSFRGPDGVVRHPWDMSKERLHQMVTGTLR